jgi:hypothetical protein
MIGLWPQVRSLSPRRTFCYQGLSPTRVALQAPARTARSHLSELRIYLRHRGASSHSGEVLHRSERADSRKSAVWAMLADRKLLHYEHGPGAGRGAVHGPGYILTHGGTNMASPLLARALGGDVFLAIVSAVAFATILRLVAGLTIAASTSLAHDLWTAKFNELIVRANTGLAAEEPVALSVFCVCPLCPLVPLWLKRWFSANSALCFPILCPLCPSLPCVVKWVTQPGKRCEVL